MLRRKFVMRHSLPLNLLNKVWLRNLCALQLDGVSVEVLNDFEKPEMASASVSGCVI